MKIILTTDVPNLGGPGDMVEVKDGYGRNYLVPRGMAIAATRGAEKQVASIRRAQETRQIRDLGHAREVAASLTGLGTVVLMAKAGQKKGAQQAGAQQEGAQSGGKLFGSVTPADVAAAVRSAGGPVLDKRTVDIDAPIKSTGTYDVTVRLHPEVSVTVPVEVQPAG
ncbi:MAG: 50S ribosomal protein L9 [Pseudonocardiales bacterium]|nr:50S ribosomal protein L9 [Pseudonocardiales bacterium]